MELELLQIKQRPLTFPVILVHQTDLMDFSYFSPTLSSHALGLMDSSYYSPTLSSHHRLGVDIRRASTSSRNVYPQLQLWDQISGTKFYKSVRRSGRKPDYSNNGYIGSVPTIRSSSIVNFTRTAIAQYHYICLQKDGNSNKFDY